jgi:hypothetical protein
MNWPNSLDVIVEYDDEDRKEKSSKLLRSVTHYGDYGPMAEYETSDGEKFWIDVALFEKSRDNKILPRIPVEVITRNAEIQHKLEDGMRQQYAIDRQQNTGLILPDGFKV